MRLRPAPFAEADKRGCHDLDALDQKKITLDAVALTVGGMCHGEVGVGDEYPAPKGLQQADVPQPPAAAVLIYHDRFMNLHSYMYCRYPMTFA